MGPDIMGPDGLGQVRFMQKKIGVENLWIVSLLQCTVHRFMFSNLS